MDKLTCTITYNWLDTNEVMDWLRFAFMLGAAIIAILISLYTMRLIPGLIGDIYGTVTTTIETVVLVFFTSSFIIHPS